MKCKNCNKDMIGDGVTSILQCLYSDETGHEPSGQPVYCKFKLAIVAPKSFEDYDLLKDSVVKIIKNKVNIVILTRTYRYNDRDKGTNVTALAEILAEHQGWPIFPYSADVEGYGKDALNILYGEMVNEASALIAFYNKKSRDVKSVIKIAKVENLKTTIVNY